jgi:hypothetical protein
MIQPGLRASDSVGVDQSTHQRPLRATAALWSITHFVLAVAIALTALFGSYSGGDWTWWLSQASSMRKVG